MVTSTATRVESNTDATVNEQIRDRTKSRVDQFIRASHRQITYRLAELDQEWDIERMLEFGFANITLGGITLATVKNRRWLLLPIVAGGFMLQHVVQGWCPPLIVLRRLGFRTAGEINRERIALKVLRDDFAELGSPEKSGELASATELLNAVEA